MPEPKSSSPTALVVIAEGSEEMEAVILIDILRRATIAVTVAGLDDDKLVTCSRQVQIKPDVSLDKVLDFKFDLIVLPGGGGGAERFAESETIHELLRRQEKEERRVACVCAAPIALISANVFKNKTMTSHPAVKDKVKAFAKAYSEERVVVDGVLTTSRGERECV